MSTAGQHKINCQDFLDQINDLVDCEVCEDLREALEEHSSKCRHCYVVYDEVRKTVQVFAEEFPCAPLPAAVKERLFKKLPCGQSDSASH